MTQAQRILALYDRLHSGERLDNATIRQDYGLTRRQAARDLALLGDRLGPLLERQREGGGKAWFFLRRTDKERSVRVRQLFAIAVGTRLASFLGGKTFDTATAGILDRLTRDLRPAQQDEVADLRDRIHVIRTGQKRYAEADSEAQPTLAAMVEGLLLDQQVELDYLSHGRARLGRPPRPLEVAPLSMVLYRGAVYFVVDVLDGDWRGPARILLALDRIRAAKATGTSFRRPTDIDAARFFSEAFAVSTKGDLQQVVLRISPTMGPYVKERWWHHSAESRSLPDGGLEVRLTVRGDEVLEWVRTMGPHVEVLAPPGLREKVRQSLQATLAHY